MAGRFCFIEGTQIAYIRMMYFMKETNSIPRLSILQSCENKIICWKPGRIVEDELKSGETSVSIVHTFECKECELWFIRFALDFSCKHMALGNTVGKVFVWDLDVADPNSIRPSTLVHPKCTSAVRQTTFSRDGNILINVCDDGSVWRWDRTDN